MPFMQITHIRRGFATNSSSTHSILELDPGQALPAPIPRDWREEDREHDDFVVSDRPSRLAFLHAMAADGAKYASRYNDDEESWRRYLQLAAVIPGPPLDRDALRDTHLDNLSGYAVPRKIHTRDMDVDFFARIVRFVMSPRVVIYGDTVWGSVFPWEETLKGEPRGLLGGCSMVSRRVSENEWTLLDLSDGRKYGVTFDESGRQTAERTNTPARVLEMVDVAISSACRRSCPFCYRASIPGGPQADLENLRTLVEGLKNADAMEMVIGGGEPTEHPDFLHFLESTDFGDLCVSFTTGDLDFVRSLAVRHGIPEMRVLDVIREKVKAVGLSVHTMEDLDAVERQLAALLDFDFHAPVHNPQMVYHFIPGPGWRDVFDRLNEKRRLALLLGMKFTGRNAQADRRVYRDALAELLNDERFEEILRNSAYTRLRRLGVDTQFIVDAASIATEWLGRFRCESWSDTEGERSVFIDLVEGTMAPCSFGGKAVTLGGYNAPELLEAFRRIGAYEPQGVGETL